MAKISRDFQIFAKPVGANCNLSCTYCYYLEKGITTVESGGVIKPRLRDKYIKQHFEATTDDTVFFSWHGGEPTLAGLEFYKDILRIQERYNIEEKRVVNGIQTNGTLLSREWGDFFAENDFVIGLSLDGPEEYHNWYRRTRNSMGSFKEAMAGWNILQECGVRSEVLCALNDINSREPGEVYRFFRDIDARYLTFLPIVERMSNGDLTDWSVTPEAFGDFLIEVFDEWKSNDIGKLEIQIIEEAMRTAFNKPHSLCILRKECGGVPILEKNGNMYCCDHYVDEGNLLGNIESTSLSDMLDSDQLRSFGQYKFSSLPATCRQCEVLDMCNGGCPKNRFVTIPGEEYNTNYLCPAYLRFFKHVKPFATMVAKLNGSI